jgi:aromatic amino acid permease
MMDVVGLGLIVVYVLICLSQLRLRASIVANAADGKLSVKMWGFPWLSWLTLAAWLGCVVLMLTQKGNSNYVFEMGAVTAGVVVLYFVWSAFRKAPRHGDGPQDES